MNEDLKQKLANYKVPENAIEIINTTPIVFIVGVSGAGKDTVIKHLLESGKYHYIVSHTTRTPRYNHGLLEENGVHYHFVDLPTVEHMIDAEGFIEAKVYSGNVYGTSVAEIQMAKDEGKIAITEIEVQGVAEYKQVAENVIPIFLLPPDYETWQKRLQDRYGDNADTEDLKKRMEAAKLELHDALKKPYFEYVVNQDLDTTVKIVDEIAHGNFSSEKNEKAKTLAQELLDQLNN